MRNINSISSRYKRGHGGAGVAKTRLLPGTYLAAGLLEQRRYQTFLEHAVPLEQ